MRYKLLGNSGLRVSELCLGAMTFGKLPQFENFGASGDESRKIFDAFAEKGGNFIDTANFYTNGESEKYVGEFVAGEREKWVVATKYSLSTDPKNINAFGNHRKNMVQAVEASLKRLNTECIDLLWLHAWDMTTPVEEVMRAFDDLVRQGKVFYIGISDTPAWIISQANTLANLRGWTPFVGLQIEYSLRERTVEQELLPMAKAFNIGVTAWSPLGGGVLTGKYNRGETGRVSSNDLRPLKESDLKIAEAVLKIGEALGKPASQVALNWLRRKNHTIPIIGARKLEQVRENLDCLDWELSDEHLKQLDEVSQIEFGFPQSFFGSPAIQDWAFGGGLKQIDNLSEETKIAAGI